jgi:hypothetical protein
MRRQTQAEDQHAQHWPDDRDRRTLTHRDGVPYEVRLLLESGMASPRRPELLVEIRQGSRPRAADNARRYVWEEDT